MPLSWPDAFLGSITGLGGIVATAVTIVKVKSSNQSMHVPEAILIQITNLSRDMEHLQKDLETLAKNWHGTHKKLNEMQMALISWGKISGKKSATETDEI